MVYFVSTLDFANACLCEPPKVLRTCKIHASDCVPLYQKTETRRGTHAGPCIARRGSCIRSLNPCAPDQGSTLRSCRSHRLLCLFPILFFCISIIIIIHLDPFWRKTYSSDHVNHIYIYIYKQE